MHSPTPLLISALFASLVTSAPAEPLAGRDACGPTIQLPTDPKDTCTALPTVSTSPGAYNINLVPLKDQGSSSISPNASAWNVCDVGISALCDGSLKSASSDAWHFTTGFENTSGLRQSPCQVGFWMPGAEGAASKPSTAHCRNVFGALKDASANMGGNQGATVNLAGNPALQPGQSFALPDGSGTGEFARPPLG
ncbi:MAG: hypothetical protein Q9212_005613 [Teloschistes hypoglaucus]